MPITIACRYCDWKGRVNDELAGKAGKCPTCGERIPIPASTTPAAVDDAPDVVDESDFVEDEPRPAAKRPSSRRDEDDRPARSRRRRNDENEDDRPARSRRRRDVDDEDDSPRRSRRRDRDHDDDRRSRRRRAGDDDRPRKRRSTRRGPPPKQSNATAKRAGALIIGLLALVVGGAWLAYYLLADARFRFYPIILLIGGIIGLFQAITGIGLGGDDEKEEEEEEEQDDEDDDDDE